MPWGRATILGGLPVWALVNFGMTDDENGRDYWSEVEDICWVRRDGSRGKSISKPMFDRAESADPYFASVTEAVSDYLAYDNWISRVLPGEALRMYQRGPEEGHTIDGYFQFD